MVEQVVDEGVEERGIMWSERSIAQPMAPVIEEDEVRVGELAAQVRGERVHA